MENGTQARTPVVRTFESDGRKFEYNYNKLRLIQVQRAETVFRYREEQESNPPITLEALEQSAGGEYMLEAFRHLLIEVQPDGTYKPYDIDSAGRSTREWLNNIDGTAWNELRECRLDFFHMAGLQDVESTKRFLRGNKLQLDAYEIQLTAQRIAKNINAMQKEYVDSTILEKLTTDSEN